MRISDWSSDVCSSDLIVKHDDEWLSAYGHNRARLVNEGQVVKAGEQIAEMGRRGAARDMLHFEIRYNGKPVDPRAYLPKRVRTGHCDLARNNGGPLAQAPRTNPHPTSPTPPAST